MTNWFSAYTEAQDSRAFGYNTHPVPANVADSLGLRQAYVSLGDVENGWALRVGRQELSFGEERLVGASNWSNVGRTFDAVRMIFNSPGFRLDAFASSVVVPTPPDSTGRISTTSCMGSTFRRPGCRAIQLCSRSYS